MQGSKGLTSDRLRGNARLPLALAVAAFACALAAPAHAKSQNGTFIIFDVPGGARDTFVNGINPAGAVTGWTFDGTVFLGFVRAPNGAITGFYTDASDFFTHGFLRAPDGTITAFDPRVRPLAAELSASTQREQSSEAILTPAA